MATRDPLDALVRKVKRHAPRAKQGKANRTLSLAEPQFSLFQRYCKSKGLKASAVVDDLIAMFLDRVQDDLPAEDEPGNDERD